jgi:hypothetical protein
MQLKTRAMAGNSRVKLWASDLPEPAETVFEGDNPMLNDLYTVTAVVNLCAGERCHGSDLQLKGRNTNLV